MRIGRALALVVVALMALPRAAFAQPAPSAANRLRLPKWDAAAGFGWLLSSESSASTPQADLVVDLGRYWTIHLKTSVQLSNAGETDHLYESDYRYSSSASQTYFAREALTSARPVLVSGSVSYQFSENVFAHPFVSGGVRLAWLSDSITNSTLSSAPPYLLGSVTSTTGTRLDARPTAAVGVKAYFANGRFFMRPELMLVVDRQGVARGVVRVLAGSDF